MSIEDRLKKEIAKHFCSDISDIFGGYICGYCENSWGSTPPNYLGCSDVRVLKWILEGDDGV
jgi:hypothetical protein